MSKTLVLAEKPSVARTLAKVIGCRTAKQGYIEGESYVVTWALGHLVTLADPEYYGKQYRTWSLESLPMLPEKMELTVIPETAKQFAAVKTLLHREDISSLVIATDAGREGELVARWIIEKAGFHKPIKRLWISSQTDKAIRDGFKNLKDGKEYINLCNAAKSRAEADWLVGLNVTRALTCKNNAQLSAGRVQTPTLAIIVERENEIKRFVPREYFHVYADFPGFSALWKGKDLQSAIYDRRQAAALCEKIKNKVFTVKDVKASEKRVPPPMLYDLTELQRDANKMFRFSPKETLSIMQRLYENHKALTYPRTDSRYLTDDIVPTLAERIRAAAVGSLSETAKEILRTNMKISKACINNAKVSDHHAIIPTEERCDLMSFSSEEKKIYLLVVSRFFSCFYPDYIYKQVKAELTCENESFFVTGKEVISEGWKKLGITEDEDEEKDEAESEKVLPGLKTGDRHTCVSSKIKECRTSPPSRYTEAALLSAMENPSKFIQDRKMKEYIGGGLGTPATRADIIEKLYSAFYIEKKDNVIYPTSKGIQLVNIVPPELREPLLTATWEMKLEAIAKGNAKKDVFLAEIKAYAARLVSDVAKSEAKYVHDNLTRTLCPQCGKAMLSVNGKKGKMLVCQDRSCGYRQNVSIKTNARCPNCHKAMDLVGSDEKKMYVCVCGFKEKADSLHSKKGEGGASKKFVTDFLKEQQKNVPQTESPLAIAMKKAMEGGGSDEKG